MDVEARDMGTLFIYSFMVYLEMLSMAQNTQHLMARYLASNEMEWM
jgi:hypothetical protein